MEIGPNGEFKGFYTVSRRRPTRMWAEEEGEEDTKGVEWKIVERRSTGIPGINR